MFVVESIHHIHVEPSVKRHDGRPFIIGCHALRFELHHGIPIAHHKTLKLPLVSKQLGEKPMASRSRFAINIIKGRHKGLHARINASLIRRQIHLSKRRRCEVYRSIVATSLRSAISSKMFGTSQHRIGFTQVPLKAFNTSLGHLTAQERVFAGTLNDTSPTRVACQIHHRSKGPVYARGRSLDGCCLCSAIHQV